MNPRINRVGPSREEFWNDPLGIKRAEATIAAAVATQRWTSVALFVTEAAAMQIVWATWDRTTYFNVAIGIFWVLAVPFLLGALLGGRGIDLLATIAGFSASIAVAIMLGTPLGSDDFPGYWYVLAMAFAYVPWMIGAHLLGFGVHRLVIRTLSVLRQRRQTG